MNETIESEQLAFWRGDFGRDYSERNCADAQCLRYATRFWAKVLSRMATRGVMPTRLLEVGANVGINLRAIRQLVDAEMYAVEPNDFARQILVRDAVVSPKHAVDGAVESIPLPDGAVDLSFTCGVLIHVPPANLSRACCELARTSSRWVLVSEYFSPHPEVIEYRGHSNKLFKCDFGAVFLEQNPGWTVVDYGFEWKPASGLDNVTWWLFEREQTTSRLGR